MQESEVLRYYSDLSPMECLSDLYVGHNMEVEQYGSPDCNLPYYGTLQLQYRKVWDYLLQLSSGIYRLMLYFRP